MGFEPGGKFGRLEIERIIGTGAFARVYLARDTLVGRPVALKVVETSAADSGSRILDEARLAGRLTSPHVVTLYGVHALPDGGWAFEMEYVGGGSLDALLRETPILSAKQRSEVIRGLARGLRAAHDADCLHGDIKPANVLLDSDGTAKLADFGLGRMLQDPHVTLSPKGDLIGTPRYMAPEVVMGQPPAKASDIWSFGVLVYQLLTGRLPFSSENLFALFHAIQNQDPAPLDPALPKDVREFVLGCLDRDPDLRPNDPTELIGLLKGIASSAPRRARSRRPAAFHGRDAELSKVEAAMTRVSAGRGAAILVSGDAGIGKTTLLREAGARARGRGYLWFEVRIAPVEGLLRPLLRVLQGHVSGRALRAVDSVTSRDELVHVIERHLHGLASEGPIGLLVEDAHEADSDEVKLLADLARRLEETRVLLAVTYRLHDASSPEESGRYHILTTRPEFEHLALRPIGPEPMLRILEGEAGRRLEPEVALRITRLADGNPLFARELLKHLREQGAVEFADEAVRAAGAWDRSRIPGRIRDLLTRRLLGLREDDRELLDVASVDGVEFDGEAVASVVDRPLLAVLRSLQRVYRERGLVQPSPDGYRFEHALIAELVYDQAAPALRRELHLHLARHLEGRGDDVDPERLGLHWERGGDMERARPHLMQAACAAERRHELRRVIQLCRRAGIAAGRMDPAAAREYAEAVICLGVAHHLTGRQPEADEVFDSLAAAAREAGDEQLRLRINIRRGRLQFGNKGLESVDERELRRAAEILPPSRELAAAHYSLARLAMYRGELGDATDRFRQADEVYRAIGDAGGHADVLDRMGSLAKRVGELPEAERLYTEAARVAEGAGRRANAAISNVNRALVAFYRGSLEGLDESLERSGRILESEGWQDKAAHSTLILAEVQYALGNVAEAKRHAGFAVQRLEKAGSLAALASAHLDQAELVAMGGSLGQAHEHLKAAEAAARKCGHQNTPIRSAALAALFHCHARDEDAAAEAGRRCVARAARTKENEVRSEVAIRLGEALLFGLPRPPVADLHVSGLSSLSGAVWAACNGGSAMQMHAAADALQAPEVGARRAVLGVFGSWLRVQALRREGKGKDALDEAVRAADAARKLGHVWQELALLSLLSDWTGSREYAARRDELSRRVPPVSP